MNKVKAKMLSFCYDNGKNNVVFIYFRQEDKSIHIMGAE